MRFDRAAIALAPRSLSNCLDLALVILRESLGAILGIWALVALPTCALVYCLVNYYEFDLRCAVLAGYLASSPLGVLLIAGVAPCAFGERFTVKSAWRSLRRSGGLWLLAQSMLARIAIAFGLMLCAIPGVWLAARLGFMAEQEVLGHLAQHLKDRRVKELMQGAMEDLIGRLIGITVYCVLLGIIVFVTLDWGSSFLLGFPILTGRVHFDFNYAEEWTDAFRYYFSYVWSDPRVVTTMLAAGLLVYVLGRLAWFLCYIDLRVRRDCWDMELQLIHEAQRLEADR
ncbi:MAG TPA: hypothetical protein VHB77_12380 [Planctomycetaceae bacterium]|nr:hypothetical protein [Planctomycetaceae bacterium]